MKTEEENPFPFPTEILHESPVSEDLLPPMFDWSPNLDWNPFDVSTSVNNFGPDQIMNSSSIGRLCSDEINVHGVELDSLLTENQLQLQQQQHQQQTSIMTFDSCAASRSNFHHHAVHQMPEESFQTPSNNSAPRLPPRVMGMSVHSHMAMACHDYTNKLSYTLTSSNKPNCNLGPGSAQKPGKSVKLSMPVVTKKSHKSRSSASGSSGRKGKLSEDPDYLAHGTGIPR